MNGKHVTLKRVGGLVLNYDAGMKTATSHEIRKLGYSDELRR